MKRIAASPVVMRCVLQTIGLALGLMAVFPALAATPIFDGEPIKPIPLTVDFDPDKAALGETLFNDPRLANNNALPCAACHQLSQGGDDGLARSITNTGESDLINAPTVFNSRFNIRQTWRGAFRTLEEQANGDLHNPRHGNTNWDELLPKVQGEQDYQREFQKIYPDGISSDNVLNAIAEYERSLTTPNSAFDRYLRGDSTAISEEALAGYQAFKKRGCVTCHQGVNVGGNIFQKVGVYLDYFADREITKADLGYYNVTKREEDRHLFRVPGLRNVAVTGPYFHDGSIETLEDAVDTMARIQLGIELDDQEIEQITVFLESLTGEHQGQLLTDGR